MPAPSPTMDLPARRYLRQSEVFAYLTRAVAEDAMAAGWLPEITRKQGQGAAASVFYAKADVIRTESRLLAGQYPEPAK